MSNLTDALIAAKLVGGSGGSGGGSGLPEVTADDNGDILTVVDGAWGKAAPSGGSDIFVIHLYLDIELGKYYTDETFEECVSAWLAGKMLFVLAPWDESYSERLLLIHGVNYGTSASDVTSFGAADVQITQGTLVYREFQFKNDGEITYDSYRYTLTPAN